MVRGGQVKGGWAHLDSVELGVGPQVGSQRTGEAGGAQCQETANVQYEGSLLLAGGGDKYGLVGSHVRDIQRVPGPHLNISVTVLLDKLIAKLVKSCSGLLVRCLHLQREAERVRPLAGGARTCFSRLTPMMEAPWLPSRGGQSVTSVQAVIGK